MSADIRVISIAAACASVLSVLTGILSGVAFGTMALRAVLSGIAFAALAAGSSFLARKFLPEIFGASFVPGSHTVATSENEPEHRLNIVLPGGEELPMESGGQNASLESVNVGEAELRDFEKEAEEIGTDSLMPSEERENEEAPKATARPPASFEDLDVLPDLDGFSDVFSAAAHEDIDANAPSVRDPISTTGASRDGVDAVAMAQAVRTLLKRDQKG